MAFETYGNGNYATIYGSSSTGSCTLNIPWNYAPTNYAYDFMGWVLNNVNYAPGSNVTLYDSAPNVTMSAWWQIKTFQVNYYDQNNQYISTEYPGYGSTISRVSYSSGNLVFCGWYTNPERTNYFDPNTGVTQAYNLYAYMVEPLAFTSSPVAIGQITYASSMGCVLFDALKSESAAKVLWDFGDGTYGKDVVMYHHYDEPGTYSVKLSVYNYGGDVDTREYDIVVYDTADGPPGNDNTLLIAGSIVAALVVGFIIARPF